MARHLAAPAFSCKRLFWTTAAHIAVLLWLQSIDLDRNPPQASTLLVQLLPIASEEAREIAIPKPTPLRNKTKPNSSAQPAQTTPLTRSPNLPAETGSPPVAQETAVHAPPEHQATPTVTAPTAAISAARFDADYLQNPAPVYPALAKRLREEGKVILRVFVEASGRPGQIELKTSSGSPRLDQAALDAVTRWKFVPARRDDEAIDTWVVVPLIFKLKD